MSINLDLRRILESPAIYTNYQKLVGGYRARRLFVENHLQVQPGQKLLDIGCGPGYLLEFLPEVNYTGVDIDEKYIAEAKELYGDKGNFICSDISSLSLTDFGSYDIVCAAGVLHHLDDNTCIELFKIAKNALNFNGRFISMDGCYINKQNRLAKLFLDLDRGQYVRDENAYNKLAQSIFTKVDYVIDESYFRIPYSSIIMECR